MLKISVIIPVYNVEQYLSRCVDSVLNQTLKDIEIVLVDDGSPDNSPEICDNYKKTDERVKVVHKKNGGLASARNAGLSVASGKYIFFLDSDDWLESDGLQTLYDTAEKFNVDLVKYRAIRTGWPGLPQDAPCMVEPIRELRDGYYDRDQIIKEIYPRLFATSQLTMGAVVGAWGALYNFKFLKDNKLKFYENVKFSEDLIFSANVMKHAKSFYFIDKAGVYHYFYNDTSISKSFREGRWESCKALISLFEKDFKNNKEFDFSNEIYYLKWFCVLLSINERRFISDKNQKFKYCKKIINDPIVRNLPLKLKFFDVSWKQKILLILIKFKMSRILLLL